MKDNQTRALFEEILAHSDDDTPRLIFADWLDEQRESARAEFIRVQVEIAALPAWDIRQVHLRLREAQLLKQHGQKWHKELPRIAGVDWHNFRRGFMATARFADFDTLAANAAACWAATPLETVITSWPRQEESVAKMAPLAGLRELSIDNQAIDFDEVDLLANAPLLTTLRSLNVPSCSLGEEGFSRLIASPHLHNLKALRAPYNLIGHGGIRALNDAASLTSLTELDLSEAGSHGRYAEDAVIRAAGIRSLVAWKGLSRLRRLKLSGNDVGKSGLKSLLRSQRVAGLKELILRSNGFDGKAMQEFNEARTELQLDLLDLGENMIEGVGASDLALAPCLRELKILELDRCEIPLSGARWLVNAPLLGSLRRLNVNHNGFGPEGLYRLLEKKPPHLHTLQIVDNDLGDEGAAHVAESPASNTLVELDMSENGLGDQAAKSLTKTKHLRNLIALRLGTTRISNAAAAALADSPLGKRLTVLELAAK